MKSFMILTGLFCLISLTVFCNPQVKMETSMGNIVIELYEEKAPNTVANFLKYVNDKFYDGLIFHRVIEDFMIQCGGFKPDLKKKQTTYPPIQNEAYNNLPNDKGYVAMARTNDPHSASSQFFINTKDNDYLNFRSKSNSGWGYAVFGKVIEGMDIVDKIQKVKTKNKNRMGNVPVDNIVILKTSVIQKETPTDNQSK